MNQNNITNDKQITERVYAMIASSHGVTTNSLAAALKVSVKSVQAAVKRLRERGKIWNDGKRHDGFLNWKLPPVGLQVEKPKPAGKIERMPSKEKFLGITWSNEIARPGGEQNRQFGSLQADGTVKPYMKPAAMCVGDLKDKVANGR